MITLKAEGDQVYGLQDGQYAIITKEVNLPDGASTSEWILYNNEEEARAVLRDYTDEEYMIKLMEDNQNTLKNILGV